MFNFIRSFVNKVMFSPTAQDYYTDLLRDYRQINSNIPFNVDDYVWIPKEIVWNFVDQSYVAQQTRREPERINNHILSLRGGWTAPVVLAYDEAGKTMIKDGNHRLMAAMTMPEVDYIPLSIEQVPRVAKGKNIGEFVDAVMNSYGEETRFRLKTREFLL